TLRRSRLKPLLGDRRDGLRLAEDAARPANAGLDALFHLYDLYLADDLLERAHDIALRARASAETSFEALERLAAVLVRMDKFEDARTVLKNMSQVAGFDPARQLRTAAQQARIGQFGDAEYSLFKALQENPADERVLAAQVEISLSKGDFATADTRATALLEAYPEFAAAWLLRAQARLSLKRYDDALADYDRVNQLAPNSEATLGGFRALAASGRLDAAQARLEQWLASHPRDLAVRTALGETLIRAGRLAPAREVYAELVAQRPGDADLLNNFAFLQFQLGQLEAAEKTAREAHAAAPQSAMVNDTLGWILARRGAHEEALPYLREALARRAGDGEIRYHLAVVLERLGRRDEAQTHLSQALRDGGAFASRTEALALRDSLAGNTP
ncbi:MAG: tetratricopeptide repeat protein, partial [Gammaproteobacteria bacterium]